MKTEKTRYVYTLSDPRFPRVVRYVGCSSNLRNRLKGHRSDAHRPGNRPVLAWLRDVYAAELEPAVEVVATVAIGECWETAERDWIARMRSNPSHDLLNVADGGAGSPGYVPGEDERRRISKCLSGRSLPEETKAKISAAQKGRPMPKHVRQMVIVRQRGKAPPAATMEAAHAALRGKKLSLERRAEMSAARKGKRHTDEARARMSVAKKGSPSHAWTQESRDKVSAFFKGRTLSALKTARQLDRDAKLEPEVLARRLKQRARNNLRNAQRRSAQSVAGAA